MSCDRAAHLALPNALTEDPLRGSTTVARVFPGAFSPVHVAIVAVVGLVVLGPEELPRAIRGAAQLWRELQSVREALTAHMDDLMEEVVPDELRGATVTAEPPIGASPSVAGDTDMPGAAHQTGDQRAGLVSDPGDEHHRVSPDDSATGELR